MLTTILCALLPCASAAASASASAPARQQAAAPDPAPPAQQEQAPARDEEFSERLPTSEEWREWLVRDRRAGFGAGTREQAAWAVETRGEGVPRALALFALGAASGARVQGRLERAAAEGAPLERCAATLALSACGRTATGALRGLLGASEGRQRECALLALLLVDPAARALAEELAARPGEPLAAAAAELLVFAREPEASEPTAASALYLSLRWHAARELGTIDGVAWDVLRARDLLADRAFVRDAVLANVDLVTGAARQDHLLAELLEGSGDGRLRAAVACMPEQLSEIVRHGFFVPSADEWRVLFDELERRALEARASGLLRAAAELPELRFRALAALARGGETQGLGAATEGLGGVTEGAATEGPEPLDPESLCFACEALAASGDAGRLSRLEALATHADARVRGAALVARTRLGSEPARSELALVLEDDAHQDRAGALEAMLRGAADPRIGAWLTRLLRDAQGEEALAIATRLSETGDVVVHERLRELLNEAPPRGAPAARAVRALGAAPSPEDLELLRFLYPVRGDRRLNLALAEVLLRARELEALGVVRSAIWDGGFDVSVLAAGLLIELTSVRVLTDELDRPPPQATSADLRRVGFALGAWGGLEEVEFLSRRQRFNSGHPAVQGALLGALTQRTR